MSMKKIAPVLASLAASYSIYNLYQLKQFSDQLTMNVEGFSVGGNGRGGLQVRTTLSINNESARPVKLKSVSGRVYKSGLTLARFRLNKPATLRARGATDINLTFDVVGATSLAALYGVATGEDKTVSIDYAATVTSNMAFVVPFPITTRASQRVNLAPVVQTIVSMYNSVRGK